MTGAASSGVAARSASTCVPSRRSITAGVSSTRVKHVGLDPNRSAVLTPFLGHADVLADGIQRSTLDVQRPDLFAQSEPTGRRGRRRPWQMRFCLSTNTRAGVISALYLLAVVWRRSPLLAAASPGITWQSP
jgi:hypothetical protein